MRAMIPHHSIAIMTSERAQIRDPRVRKPARGTRISVNRSATGQIGVEMPSSSSNSIEV
jgi:uncharacterized protein (DUF305 family)